MRVLSFCLALTLWAAPLAAAEKIDRLMAALQLEQVIDILRQEGQGHGQELNRNILGNSGGAYFDTRLQDIYDPEWMREQITGSFQDMLTDSQIEDAITFFESDLGQTVVALENSARLAFMDETIQDMAQDSYAASDHEGVRHTLIAEYIAVNNLIENNVQSALSADFNFFRGLNDDVPVDEGEILAQLLADKDGVTDDTTTWLYSFLLVAYQPLSEADLRENIAFSRSESGQAINEAFFVGFDHMYDQIYYQLGQAVSDVLGGSDL